jgi:hypothetical protein
LRPASWFDDNGEPGYEKFVAATAEKVRAFNDVERENDSGTTRDPEIETFLTDAVIAAPKRVISKLAMGARGASLSKIHNKPVFFFSGYGTIADFEKFVRGGDDDEYEVNETKGRRSEFTDRADSAGNG